MTDTQNDMNKKLRIAKRVARFVAVRSVSGVIVTMIHQNTAVESKLQKGQLYIGAFLLGSVVADKVWEHTEAEIDGVVDAVREAKRTMSNATATADPVV